MDNHINLDWEEQYKFLEGLRRTGVCNMYGAGVYLEAAFNITTERAQEILLSWMKNYSVLTDRYNWDKDTLKK